MQGKELRQILRKYYSEQSVKFIMTLRARPAFEKMLILKKNHGIPLEAWENIRAWVGEKDLKRDER